MKFCNMKTALMSLVLLMVSANCAQAYADSYSVKAVAFTQSESFVAGDDLGDYIINISNRAAFNSGGNCGGVISTQCFETHYAASPGFLYTTTAPTLWSDPAPVAGSEPCALAAGSGFSATHVLCNNGHMIFAGFYDKPDGSMVRGIWAGSNPDPLLSFLSGGSIDGGFMTPNGNAFFIDGLHDTLDVAINLDGSPVPEPGCFALMGTGALSLLGFVRRGRPSSV